MEPEAERTDLSSRGPDRRRRPTPMFSRFLLLGRRASGRRDGERRFSYVDRPGIIGTVGTLLGEHHINIATMDVGRRAEGGEALMCLTVDTEVPPNVLQHVAGRIDAHQLRTVTLPI